MNINFNSPGGLSQFSVICNKETINRFSNHPSQNDAIAHLFKKAISCCSGSVSDCNIFRAYEKGLGELSTTPMPDKDHNYLSHLLIFIAFLAVALALVSAFSVLAHRCHNATLQDTDREALIVEYHQNDVSRCDDVSYVNEVSSHSS